MKKKHFGWVKMHMEDLLGQFDEDGGNPEFCDELLAERMAKAAEAVYDSCMAGQKFAREHK
jgi:hypothetical protein